MNEKMMMMKKKKKKKKKKKNTVIAFFVSHRACASNGYPLTPPQGAVQLRFASL